MNPPEMNYRRVADFLSRCGRRTAPGVATPTSWICFKRLDVRVSGTMRPLCPIAVAAAFLAGLGFEGDVRIRIYGRDGELLADSRRVLRQSGSESQPYGSSAQVSGRQRLLYRLGAWIVRIRDALGAASARYSLRPSVPPSPRTLATHLSKPTVSAEWKRKRILEKPAPL